MIRVGDIEIDRLERTISHRGVSTHFAKGRVVFELACYFILSGGASKEMAFWHLYANDSEGGPLDGPHIIHIHLNQLSHRHLKRLNLEVRSWKISSTSFYEIVPTYQIQTPNRFSHKKRTRVVIAAAGQPINSSSSA